MARPRKSELRDRQLNFSLTATEYNSIVARANALGMRPIHFGRLLLLRDKPDAPACTANSDTTSRLILSQLSRLGNNLNQMVRHLHTTGDPLPVDLEPLLRDIRHVLARAVGK